MAEHFWSVEKDPHKDVFSILGRLKKSLDARNRRWCRFMAMLLGRPVKGFRPGELFDADEEIFRRARASEKQLVLNTLESISAALAARIASQQPYAMLLASTTGPNAWEQKQKALSREKFIAGEWYRVKWHRKITPKVFLQSAAAGFSAAHIFPGYDRLCFEIAPPWEFIVDEQAAVNGETQVLFREKYVTLEKALARFANAKSKLSGLERRENETAIRKASERPTGAKVSQGAITEQVRLVEAWHLPSGWGADDGRHFVCCEARTLTPAADWGWKKDHVPFSFFPWSEPLIGWYPQGLVERGETLQGQLNKMLGRLQEALHLHAVANTWYEEGSINKTHMKNVSGNLIPYKKGTRPPTTIMPNALSAELVRTVEGLEAWMYKSEGVSELSAASVKPAGIESGRGLLVLKDSEGGRHALRNQAWDGFNMDAADLTVEAGAELYERIGDFTSNYVDPRGRHSMERVAFSAGADLSRDCYEIQVFPSSQLPHEPAGRWEQVQQWLNAGMITMPQAKQLMKMPDLDQFLSLDTAAIEDVEMQIGMIFVEGKGLEEDGVAPKKYQDLEYGLAAMTSAALRGQQQGAPKERVEVALQWIERADAIMSEVQEAAAAQQAAANPVPPGAVGPLLPGAGQQPQPGAAA